MKVFKFSPSNYTEAYKSKGYAFVKDGVSPAFVAYAQKALEAALADQQASLRNFKFAGKKQQFLFEFPADSDFPGGVFETVATVAGLPLDRMTLCERHLKVYDSEAKSNPPAHKDRVASQVAVGLPLKVSQGSNLVLYPNHYLEINPFNSTAEWRDHLDEADLPEKVLKDVEPVYLDAQPGDVVLFRGSSIYHERRNPANTAVLYLKFNAMRLDPIGEDPSTPVQRKKSLEILQSSSDEELLNSVTEVSPRLAQLGRYYTRWYWKEVIQANVWGEKPFTLSEDEFRIMINVDGKRTVRHVIERLGVPEPEYLSYVPRFRRLARLQGIDFISQGPQQ